MKLHYYFHSSYRSIFFYLGILLCFRTILIAQESHKTNNYSSIRSLSQEAKNEEQKGNYELAKKYYTEILILNPNNKKALCELEKLNNFSKKQNQELHEETCMSLLKNVEESWESPSKNKNMATSKEMNEIRDESNDNDAMIAKLTSLIIPTIDLEDITISEAIDYLRQKSCLFDPVKKGINIVLNLPSVTKKETSISAATLEPLPEPHISLQLHEVPIYVALEYVAKQAGLSIHIDPYSVVLLPESECASNFITKEYLIPSHFIPIKKDVINDDEKKIDEDNTKNSICYSAKEYLESEGITFPVGSSANYISSSNKLIIHNTKENIELVDILLAASQRIAPAQISIETKFIEVSQDQLEQLGFNWLLGAFELGSSGIDMSGGGNTTILNTNAYPFPATGMNPIGDLQSGNTVIQENSIDSVLDRGLGEANTSRSVPGVFSVAGVYSNPQFQLVLRALHQKKGIDLMAAPHVTTKNGIKATVKIIDEFIYPTQYAPPQIPQSTTNSGNNIIHEAPPTIAPAFPNSWTTKNLGVTLEAKPTIGPDGYTIELELHPQITDFDGFINYGSPINTIGYGFSTTNASMVPFSSTLTTNTINQPVFTIREVNTSVTVWDGQTVILGGLIREDTQKIEDKIPFLGDIPLAGRLFRSKADKKLRKNLIIFVTPKILNAEGAPLLNPSISD